jgi:DNA-binding protein Fis
MVPVHQSGNTIMSQLTENQLTSIVEMIVDDYGSRLNGGEVSEVIGLILENISGFEWPGWLSHITPILA